MTETKPTTAGRGGARPGAGRPAKGYPPNVEAEAEALSAAALALADAVEPLAYALRVMRDATAPTWRRDRMAALAMPYCHARASDAALGKKAMAQAAADTAGTGTDWGSDLDTLN